MDPTCNALVPLGKVVNVIEAERAAKVKNNLDQSGPFISIGGLAVASFLYGYTAIVLPSLLYSVAMPLFWCVLFVLACAWFAKRPRTVVVLPVLAIAVWFVVILGLGARA